MAFDLCLDERLFYEKIVRTPGRLYGGFGHVLVGPILLYFLSFFVYIQLLLLLFLSSHKKALISSLSAS